MVAAVLAVLNVLAITSDAARRKRHGEIRAKTIICARYHVTWQASPASTTTISQRSDWKTRSPSFWPTLDATTPKTASGTRATTQSKTRIKSSKPTVSRSTTARYAVSPRARCSLRIFASPIPSARVRRTSWARLFCANASPTLTGISSTRRSVTLFFGGGGGGLARSTSSAPRPGRIRFARSNANPIATSVLIR